MKTTTIYISVLCAALAACSEKAPSDSAASAPAASKPVANAVATDSECSAVFTGNHSMVYDKRELTIDTQKCKEFTVTVRNVGHLPRNSRGHNFVLAKASDEKAILMDGLELGPKSDFLKPNDPRVIAYTKLAGGGEEQSVTFKTNQFQEGETYLFFCSFLGHHKMRGPVYVKF